jgi:hypothetical protein
MWTLTISSTSWFDVINFNLFEVYYLAVRSKLSLLICIHNFLQYAQPLKMTTYLLVL